MVRNGSTARSHGWSPELLTVLGAMLAIGVGLAGLILNMQAQVRDDMRAMETRIHTMEARIREDMVAMEKRIRGDMAAMEVGIREDMAAMDKRIREDMAAMEKRIRGDMAAMEAGIREDMAAMETGIRRDMGAMEVRIREDVRELRGDVGEVRERVSHLEGRFDGGGMPAPRVGGGALPNLRGREARGRSRLLAVSPSGRSRRAAGASPPCQPARVDPAPGRGRGVVLDIAVDDETMIVLRRPACHCAEEGKA